jgi:hypothetical protein
MGTIFPTTPPPRPIKAGERGIYYMQGDHIYDVTKDKLEIKNDRQEYKCDIAHPYRDINFMFVCIILFIIIVTRA